MCPKLPLFLTTAASENCPGSVALASAVTQQHCAFEQRIYGVQRRGAGQGDLGGSAGAGPGEPRGTGQSVAKSWQSCTLTSRSRARRSHNQSHLRHQDTGTPSLPTPGGHGHTRLAA